jgi:hypothetical protein
MFSFFNAISNKSGRNFDYERQLNVFWVIFFFSELSDSDESTSPVRSLASMRG